MARIKIRRSPEADDLFQAMLTLQNVEECYTFFSDLLTVQELGAISQRLTVARMLADGSTYDMIRQQLPVSSSTITRVNTELRYGSGGYRMVLERMGLRPPGDLPPEP